MNKFKIGQKYFYILWGEVSQGILEEIRETVDGFSYSFKNSDCQIDRERVFVSRKKAENWVIANEKHFLQKQLEQISYDIENCDFNIDLYSNTKKKKEAELKKLQKRLDNCK